jgi:Uncharacterized conserved protein
MITLIGSGNVATWMAQRLQGSSRFPITQVYSRTLANARVLADLCGAEAIDNIKELNPDNQVFVFALADKAYDEILPQLPFKLPMAFMTSGTVSCQCLKDYADCYGVIYPLQTFTKSQDMRTLEVPLCLESDFVGKQKPIMWELARELSPLCYEVSESQRAQMHVAAVFACNFSNAMYRIAFGLLEKQHIDTAILHPLILETALKIQKMHPSKAQTGPAIRHDGEVMRSHLELLKNEKDEWSEVYQLMSRYIAEQHTI